MVVRGSAWRAAIWTSWRLTPASSMVVTKNMPEHMWVHSGHFDSGGVGQVPQPAGGGVAIHAGAGAVEQDRPSSALTDGAVDRAAYRWWERDRYQFGAFAAYPQDPVPVLFAKILDSG